MKHLLFPVALVLCQVAYSQKALTHYFPAGQINAGLLVQPYITPLAEDLGSLANNGWYNTAATHKRFGFDISLTMNAVFIDGSRKFYNPPATSGTDFNGTVTSNGIVDKIPTIYGNTKEFPNFANNATNPVGPTIFQGPDGIDPQKTYGVNAQVLPTIQAGIGLFANTDLRVRYTPQQTINGIKSGTVGGAIMHDIKQHIPGLKMVPFSLSVLIGYTKLDGNIDLSGTYVPAAGKSVSDQKGVISGSATTAQVLISKSLAVVTFYGSLGYNSSTTKFDVKGSYVVDKTGDPAHLPLIPGLTLNDPYHFSASTSGFRATGGMRLKLGPFFLSGDYTFFNGQRLLTVGSGFTFH